MFHFYKKYILGHSTIVAPLNRLFHKNATVTLTEVEHEAFEVLRERLKNVTFMQYPNDTGLFTLETDASTQALGYILYQSRSTGGNGIVACGDKNLRGAEFYYTVTE